MQCCGQLAQRIRILGDHSGITTQHLLRGQTGYLLSGVVRHLFNLNHDDFLVSFNYQEKTRVLRSAQSAQENL